MLWFRAQWQARVTLKERIRGCLAPVVRCCRNGERARVHALVPTL